MKTMLILAPVTSRSGYGDHARDLVLSFLDMKNYIVKVIDCPWGQTPKTALKNGTEESNRILDVLHTELSTPAFENQPDIYVDIRIPNEFQRIGKYNIGITAGIESNAVSQKWIEGCNAMDLVIVPSEHSKAGFVNSAYDMSKKNPQTGEMEPFGQLTLNKPMEVVFEGVREEVFKPLHHKEIDTKFFDWLNDEVPERFAFLFVGQWCKGAYGEDRKDIMKLIKLFYETFANKKKMPALILKTSGAKFSILDREECKNKINEIKKKFPKDVKLPNIYLLHGNLSETELNYLYNHPKIKSMVNLTHGEGFGRPLLEATMTGLPLITTAWSGQLDFTDKEKNILLGGKLEQIPKSVVWEDILIPQSKWFVVDEMMTRNAMTHMYENHSHWKSQAQSLMRTNREKFTRDKMTEKLREVLEKSMTGRLLSEHKSLNMPKLIKRK